MASKKDLMKMIRLLMDSGMLAGSYGNMSVRGKGRIHITPSAIPYHRMSERDAATISYSGNVLSGVPSSEWRMHLAIYKARQDLNAIVHLHSPYSSVLAVMRKPARCLTEESIQLIGREIPVAKYHITGSEKLAEEVASKFSGSNAAIMANHGIVVGGRTWYEAYLAAMAAEKACMIEVLSGGKGKGIPERDVEELRRKFEEYRKRFL